MPQPMIGRQGVVALRGVPARVSTTTSTGPVLGKPRTAPYLNAVGRLDAHSTLTAVELADVIDAIHREFAEAWSAVPQGFVGHCYLGPPFEAHTLTIDGQIIEHYRAGQALPGRLEEARSLARTDHYLVIEVYPDRLVCVRPDGSVVTVGG